MDNDRWKFSMEKMSYGISLFFSINKITNSSFNDNQLKSV